MSCCVCALTRLMPVFAEGIGRPVGVFVREVVIGPDIAGSAPNAAELDR